VYLLLHHALLLKFRLVVFHYKDKDEAQHVLVELKRLAKKINEQIDSPRTIVETLREEAGYLRSLGGDVNLAEEQLDKAKTVFLTIAVRPIPAQLSLARPELEILRMRNDPKFEKKALKYVRLLERHPSAYNLNQLKQLLPQEMYGGQTVQLVVNGPIYTTPLMPYLYYEDFSLRREGLL